MASIFSKVTYTRPSTDVSFYTASAKAITEFNKLESAGLMERSLTSTKRLVTGQHTDDPLKYSFVTQFYSTEAYLDFKANAIMLAEAEKRNTYNEQNGITRLISIDVEYDSAEDPKINIDSLTLSD
tara:strand:+ start:2887 stop:3264 length:378 start_codon:yes stop_codon:yes gene_type:complete